MGLFGFIKETMETSKEEAENEVKRWNVNNLVDSIQNCSNLVKLTVYKQELFNRCYQMSDAELGRTFDRVLYQKKLKVCRIMLPIMKNRDLAYEDDDGKIHRTY